MVTQLCVLAACLSISHAVFLIPHSEEGLVSHFTEVETEAQCGVALCHS